MYRTILKPLIDFLAAAIAFALISPLFVLITIVLFFSNKGTPFFYQLRPGKNEKQFGIIKFKTMTDEIDENGKLLLDEKRMTKTGTFIRSTSLDELPQLINVIKGDMSIVGPRPLLVEYLPLYYNFQKQRHLVKPGITGYAQVNGRNDISWERKFELDVWYVKNQSVLVDLKVILKTIKKVVIKEGVSKEGHVTTTPFKGN